ncbi:MAG TPA: metallophosphoesterase [Vicinamibacterales bacterium]|nr:metallophosphoesterase [Vicinamibacterales bacterium]
MIFTRTLLLSLAIVAGQPAPTPAPRPPAAQSEKMLAVRLDPFRFVAGAPPAGWADPSFDDRTWSGPAPGPFAPRQPPLPGNGQPPAGVALFDVVPGQPLLLRARFAVPEARRVRVLELRVGYNDGFVAYVNGREVARRGIVAAAAGLAGAVPHGAEVERVYVAVPSPALAALAPEGNLLAIAIYPYSGRNIVVPTAPSARVDLAAASGVRIVRGPYLGPLAEASGKARVNVIWETDLPVTGKVSVTPASDTPAGAGATRVVPTRAPGVRHVITLDGLARGSAHRYRVAVEATPGDAAASAPARFETLPAPPAPARFAVYGDMRYPGHEAHRTVVDALVREAPPLVINTGDLTDVGSEESNWQRYFDVTAPLGAIAPVVPVLGNHDTARRGEGAAKTWGLFAMPQPAPPFYTSFDLGGVHFVALDTNDGSAAQREWLESDLAGARRHNARAVFAFCHEPPWSHGLHGDSHRIVRDYAPLLVAGHTDVLFCGHDHIYERGAGPTPAGKLAYVVTGGGGAPLYNPRCQAATGPPPGDVPGPLPPCPSTVSALTKTFHYVLVTVAADGIQLCPKRPDGSAVEPCVQLPPHRR